MAFYMGFNGDLEGRIKRGQNSLTHFFAADVVIILFDIGS